ncbi:hypothetical protein AAEO50_05655 [Rossellomorea oryzaecorticis]|uniref:Uncharacterized protein n=1 Tax=Rossellomorea oryzaecorticis TaxID=1396505 RepID=A0ABU9KA12_9BACI
MLFSMAMIVIFGGGFLIRLVRDGDFYIAEFAGGMSGIALLIMTMFVKKGRNKPSYRD